MATTLKFFRSLQNSKDLVSKFVCDRICHSKQLTSTQRVAGAALSCTCTARYLLSNRLYKQTYCPGSKGTTHSSSESRLSPPRSTKQYPRRGIQYKQVAPLQVTVYQPSAENCREFYECKNMCTICIITYLFLYVRSVTVYNLPHVPGTRVLPVSVASRTILTP